MATKGKPPRKVPQPLDKTTEAYYEAKLVVFDFESREALRDQDWKRLKALFLDFGTFIQRHPRSVNGKVLPLPVGEATR